MNDVIIERFEKENIPFGRTLTDNEGWRRTGRQWNEILEAEPTGLFVAFVGGREAGVGGVVTYGPVAWIHSVIVKPEFRGIGVGKAVVEKCSNYARQMQASTLKLDATPMAKDFYKRMGYIEEFKSLRFEKKSEFSVGKAETISRRDLDSIWEFDREMTGLDRRKVLVQIYRDNPRIGFVVRNGSVILGYVMASQAVGRVEIGPCVVRGGARKCAETLLNSVSESVSGELLRICMGSFNAGAIDLVTELGFRQTTPSTRMYSGEKLAESVVNYAMISPAKG